MLVIEKIGLLDGHKNRVLYMSISPDGQTIASAAGDETLKFWNVFPENKKVVASVSSELNYSNYLLR